MSSSLTTGPVLVAFVSEPCRPGMAQLMRVPVSETRLLGDLPEVMRQAPTLDEAARIGREHKAMIDPQGPGPEPTLGLADLVTLERLDHGRRDHQGPDALTLASTRTLRLPEVGTLLASLDPGDLDPGERRVGVEPCLVVLRFAMS